MRKDKWCYQDHSDLYHLICLHVLASKLPCYSYDIYGIEVSITRKDQYKPISSV
jgi:hypothetical protein